MAENEVYQIKCLNSLTRKDTVAPEIYISRGEAQDTADRKNAATPPYMWYKVVIGEDVPGNTEALESEVERLRAENVRKGQKYAKIIREIRDHEESLMRQLDAERQYNRETEARLRAALEPFAVEAFTIEELHSGKPVPDHATWYVRVGDIRKARAVLFGSDMSRIKAKLDEQRETIERLENIVRDADSAPKEGEDGNEN